MKRALALILMITAVAWAGELVVYNLSDHQVRCSVDGYTKASGAESDLTFRIDPGQKLNIPPNAATKNGTLNTAECGKLKVRAMGITPQSPDRVLFLNGRQVRVLNALLYASIPTDPVIGFTPLVRWLTLKYQASHPDVLLNLVLDPAIDVYSFANLKNVVFSPAGYDVAEIDTVFLQWLKHGGLISRVSITGEEPWPVAAEAVRIDGQAYGVPSWLCSEFLMSTNSGAQDVRTFPQMQAFMQQTPAGLPALVGDLNGTWTIPALYIQAFVQSHPGTSASAAVKGAIDPAAIARMARFGTYCELSKTDFCIDGTFHNAKDSTVEQTFVAERATSTMGFAERSFFIAHYQQAPLPLWLAPVPWGDAASTTKLAYSDAFVNNQATCSASPCATYASEFAAFMTSAATKKYIALSSDLPNGAPRRHLIVATKPFYDDPEVRADPIYAQITAGFLKADLQPYSNAFTPQSQYDLLSGICPLLKQQSADWKCKIPSSPE